MELFDRTSHFWNDVRGGRDSAATQVLGRVALFGAFALLVTTIDRLEHLANLRVAIAPYEVAGAVFGMVLVLRTNAGLDRWQEGRKLWGAIVNQSRNLAIIALAFGPDDKEWKKRLVYWTATFAHAARRSLRGEREVPEIALLIGADPAARLASADHMPSAASSALARLLQEACERGMDRFAFLEAERERSQLLDHLGGCERILKTPLPSAYSIQIRRFIVLFLATSPFALVNVVGWLAPLVTMLVAYPILELDFIGEELQSPFSTKSVNHLPLDEICATIERNVLALFHAQSPGAGVQSADGAESPLRDPFPGSPIS
jgi:putative membrane protein